VVVVDNGSFDDSVSRLQTWVTASGISVTELRAEDAQTRRSVDRHAKTDGPGTDAVTNPWALTIICCPENRGFAAGNNVGIGYALNHGAEYVLLLNNDTIVDSEFLTHMVSVGESDDRIGIVGPKIYNLGGPDVLQSVGATLSLWTGRGRLLGAGERDCGQRNAARDVDWVSGAAIMIKRAVLQTVGVLDERFFLTYEETDLCHRAKAQGFRITVAPDARVWHKGGASTHQPTAEFYLTKNRALFMRKNATWYQTWVFLLFYTAGSLRRFLLRAWQRDRASALAIARGFASGLRALLRWAET
jgi:GT2 family glycosyltransferase